ncbi:VTT domain-containing protein [Halococcoides cellulosivorans]|uniref:VTT domain-containing protein n=1 Tax=Halococcoides cellulosivorans TaxID=1679096 RepID=A0A2R4X075_9EURY|nr:VTT domain-containing protein [Halococcoides cellulosivorans]AWB27177.1 hypothetical protein HARCEL1_05390 [Halococcoides cellulosivorans]
MLTDGIVIATPALGPWVERSVRTATGPVGLVIVFVYSVAIVVALPTPGELVLAAPLDLGVGHPATLATIVLVSATGKALGSVLALRIGHGVSRSDPVLDLFRRAPIDVVGYSETTTVAIARRYGYVGLAVVLSVPTFPDTLPVYACSVVGSDARRFALATFVGSIGRLVIVLGAVVAGIELVGV